MVTIEEYASYDATGLAGLVRSGEVKPAEIHEAGIKAVELANERLHATVEGPWDSPLDASTEGVFAGVPFVLKDLCCHAAGVPLHLGSRALAAGIVLDHDSELMARFRRAGLAAVGSTKIPEFALCPTTEPLFGGAVHNPWDPTKSPGGSSGGSAALVAAGAVPIAHANDGAGSIRIPACHTGTVGLKPSRGRIPIGPGMQEAFYGNVVEFALTRSVRDAAALLDAVHGNLPGEKYGAPGPARPYRDEMRGPQSPLRIAVCLDSWSDRPVHGDVRRVLMSTIELLSDLGHEVDVVTPALKWEEFLDALTTTFCAGSAADVIPLGEAIGVGLSPDHFEATTIACAEAGRALTPVDLARAFATNNRVSRQVAAFMADWDILVTPTAITPPVDLGTFDANDASFSAQEWVRHVITPHPMCALYNVTGAPAISLPLGTTSDGLPVGVQFGADVYREDLLLGLAAQLEQARPWAERRPALHVTNLSEGS
ncbi:amidase [Rhodococcus sp. ACS1]|uniref:amidase n=1 Tax=Rhodococcus sp. ACS1 TaxID=2028570 RepID=UPI000BB100B1|nr:amidase family protein [Rhodococcus sp. ACS1]PBC46121.1 amidase [Rhodococcus sp. ACS1]